MDVYLEEKHCFVEGVCLFLIRQKVVTVQKKKQKKKKHVMRKQIFCQNLYSVVSDQVRHKPGCTATEDR